MTVAIVVALLVVSLALGFALGLISLLLRSLRDATDQGALINVLIERSDRLVEAMSRRSDTPVVFRPAERRPTTGWFQGRPTVTIKTEGGD